MALTITRDDAKLIATETATATAAAMAEREADDSFKTLVRAVLEDVLEPGQALKEMGRHFGPWKYGEGFSHDAVEKFPWLVPFFFETEADGKTVKTRNGVKVFKRHAPRGPMSSSRPLRDWNFYDPKVGGWKAWGDVMLRLTNDPRRNRKFEEGPGWFTRTQIAEEFPWLVPDADSTDGDAYFLRGLGNQKLQAARIKRAERLLKELKNGEKRSGYIDFYESLRLFLRDFLARKVISFDQVVELFRTFSLEDLKNLKLNKGWRDYADQYSGRRQEGEGGKTLIWKTLKSWGFYTYMIRDCLLFIEQDVLAGEKPAATEATQAQRLNFVEIKNLTSKVNLVWMFPYIPSTGWWMRMVALFRIAGIRPNIYDDLSGEEPFRDTEVADEIQGVIDEYDEIPWPAVSGTVTPTWRLAAELLFERNDSTGNRVLRRQRAPQAFVNSLWDQYRLWLWAKINRPTETAILKKIEEGLFVLDHKKVMELRDENVWREERESNLLLAVLWPKRISPERIPVRYVMDPVVLDRILRKEEWQDSLAEVSPALVSLVNQGNDEGLDPKERKIIRRNLEAALRKIIRNPQDLVTVLRKICGAINVAVIYGWSEVPYQGLARMMQLADDTWDVAAFLFTELADGRFEKGLQHNDMGIVAAYREPVCWHPYDPKKCPNHNWTNNSGIICRGWKFNGWQPLWGGGPIRDYEANGGVEPPVYWFLRNRWSWLLEKIHMANLRSGPMDKIKYRGRAKELGAEKMIPETTDELNSDSMAIAQNLIPKDMMTRSLSKRAEVNPLFRGKQWPLPEQIEDMDAADALVEYNWGLLVQRTVSQMVNVFNVMFRRHGKTFTYDEILELVELASKDVDCEVIYGLRFHAERPDAETEGENKNAKTTGKTNKDPLGASGRHRGEKPSR